jgi:hypothetical protein
MRFFDVLSIGGSCSVVGTVVGMGVGVQELVLASALVGWILFAIAVFSMTELGTTLLKSSYETKTTTGHESPSDSPGH